MANRLIMKKIASIILLLTRVVYAQTSTQILPELDDFMTLKPIPDKYFEHNAYVGWMGLTYPKDNWAVAYRDVFQANDEMINQSVNNGRLITNYFVNPKPVVLLLSSDQKLLNDLFGSHNALSELEDFLYDKKLLSFRQKALDNKRYRYTKDFFVCGEYLDDQCLAKMLEHHVYIEETIQNNQVLLNRFEELVQTSKYNYALFYNDYNASIDTVPSSGMIKLIQLYLADAMIKIVAGHQDEGIDQLVIVRQWIDLMFEDQSKAALLHFIVNISVTQFLDQTINVLLDENLLTNMMNDERVQFIVRPYPEGIGKKLNEVVLFEMKQNFKDFAYPYLKVYEAPSHNPAFTEEDEFIILSYLKNFGVILSPELKKIYAARSATAKNANWSKLRELQKATQSIDKIWFGVVHQAREAYPNIMDQEEELALLHSSHEYFIQVLTEWHQKYFQTLGISPREALYALNKLYPSTEFYNDYFKMVTILSSEAHLKQHLSLRTLHALLKDQIMPETLDFAKNLPTYSDFDDYWMRLYEQQNYHQLVYLKYLMMNEKISVENIPVFLNGMGDLARNTITNQTYIYDEETGKLWTPLPRQNKYLPAHIKISRLYNSNIQNFEVILPRY